jgi:hypothetical protein
LPSPSRLLDDEVALRVDVIAAGFGVRRNGSPEDRRSVYVHLTSEGGLARVLDATARTFRASGV